jgi:hypothetical protein
MGRKSKMDKCTATELDYKNGFEAGKAQTFDEENNLYILKVTKEELDFIYDRCSRKAARLEESNLKDVPCYALAWRIISKIFRVRDTKKDTVGEVAK